MDGTLYGFVFKGANKSTVWYNVKAFEDAGVQPPATWEDLLPAAKTLKASGVKAYSIGGADGWTLTDLFENIYLRTAGPDMYDQLTNARHPVDRRVGDHGTRGHGAGLQRHRQHRRRRVGGLADRLPDVGDATSTRTRPRLRWCSRATSSRA